MTTDTNRRVRKFHIAFGVDERFFFPMGVTITSIIKNNPELDFVFHVFAPSFSDAHRRKLEAIENEFGQQVMTHAVDEAILSNIWDFHELQHFSPAIFTRILMPQALKGITDKFLYLDADILCVNDMSELVDMDLSDVAAAVVGDDDKNMAQRCAKLNMKHSRYFNSGVLLINIENWIADQITEKTLRCMAENANKFLLPDQDALNIVLEGKAKFIDRKWNYLYRLVEEVRVRGNEINVPSEAIFIHYIGWLKPWREWNSHESRNLFLEYQALSPWKDQPLTSTPPANYKEMHIYALIKFREGNFMKGLAWYSRYFSRKYFKK